MADLKGFQEAKPPEILVEDALKLKYLEGSATPFFIVEVLVFQVYRLSV